MQKRKPLTLPLTELMWARVLLRELRTAEDGPSVFWQDNAAVIRNTRNPTKHEASKHINVKFLYKRELCEKGFLDMLSVPSKRQLADALTKPLDAPNFLRLHDGYMGHSTGRKLEDLTHRRPQCYLTFIMVSFHQSRSTGLKRSSELIPSSAYEIPFTFISSV